LVAATCLPAALLVLPWSTIENPGQLIGTAGFCLTDASDTCIDIVRRFGVGYVEFRAANSDVDPWLPGEGRVITNDTH
jgi:hypothetical protein